MSLQDGPPPLWTSFASLRFVIGLPPLDPVCQSLLSHWCSYHAICLSGALVATKLVYGCRVREPGSKLVSGAFFGTEFVYEQPSYHYSGRSGAFSATELV